MKLIQSEEHDYNKNVGISSTTIVLVSKKCKY